MFGHPSLRNEETIKINVQDMQMARWKCSDHRRISCYVIYKISKTHVTKYQTKLIPQLMS